MTKKSPETLVAICDTMASGILTYSQAAVINGVSERVLWLWIKQSQQDDPTTIIEFLGETVQFARALHGARRIALHGARGRMEQKGIFGWDEPIFYNGMPTWKPDPVTVGWSEDERTALGFRADGLLEVDGKVVQNALHHEPPVALALRIAEMAFPKEYRPGVNSDVNVNHSGVIGIAHTKRDYSGGPPAVPPPPVRPQLEVLTDDPELDDILGLEPTGSNDPVEQAKDVQPADILGTPPEAVGPTRQQEPVIRDTPTVAETPLKQEGVLAPAPHPLLGTPKTVPPSWREEWNKLQARSQALPDKLNRGR